MLRRSSTGSGARHPGADPGPRFVIRRPDTRCSIRIHPSAAPAQPSHPPYESPRAPGGISTKLSDCFRLHRSDYHAPLTLSLPSQSNRNGFGPRRIGQEDGGQHGDGTGQRVDGRVGLAGARVDRVWVEPGLDQAGTSIICGHGYFWWHESQGMGVRDRPPLYSTYISEYPRRRRRGPRCLSKRGKSLHHTSHGNFVVDSG